MVVLAIINVLYFQALGMLFWHEYNAKKALDDMPNFKAFQGMYILCVN